MRESGQKSVLIGAIMHDSSFISVKMFQNPNTQPGIA